MRKTISVALLLFAAEGSAHAADWYANPAADPGGDGSQAKPFATIAASLAVMSRGDTLWLASGTFAEVVNIAKLPGTSGTTTIRAMAGATPVIDGASGSAAAQFVVQTSVPDTTFQGLTITNAVGGALGIQFYHADGGQVIDCTTTKMSSNAVTFYYASQGVVSGCTLQGNVGGRKTTGTVVTHNEVYGSGAEGIGLYNGSTGCTIAHNVVHDNYSVNIYLDSISHSLIDGNLVYESDPTNDLDGIEFSDEHYDDLDAPVNSYNTVINNVIVGHSVGIAFWMSDEWSDPLQAESGLRYDVIANNTLIDNAGSVRWDASPAHVGTTMENNLVLQTAGSSPSYLLDAKSTAGITLDHNLWFAPDLAQPFLWVNDQTDHAGWLTASGQGAADVLADPKLVGGAVPPAANAALTSSSPAIDAGMALASVTDDYLGAARPAGNSDIGAFQYGAVAAADAGAGTGAPPVDAGTVPGSPDSGTGGESGGGSDAGASSTVAGDAGLPGRAPAPIGSSSASGGGSGCTVSGSPSSALPWGLGALGAILLLRRRKRW